MSATRSGPGVPTAAPAKVVPPVIPLSLVDAPTQRLWAVSSIAALQAYKLFFLSTLKLSGEAAETLSGGGAPAFAAPLGAVALLLHPLFAYAVLLDLAIIATLVYLRIPRLAFAKAVWIGVLVAVAVLDWLFLGGWRTLGGLIGYLPLIGPLTRGVASIGDTLNPWAGQPSIGGGRVRVRQLTSASEHIIGQHTIHILPYSTATLNPLGASPMCHCLGPLTPQGQVYLPVLFNNTEPRRLQYSITPFTEERGSDAKSEIFDVTIPKSALTRVGAVEQWEEGDELDLALYDLPKRDKGPSVEERGARGTQASASGTQRRGTAKGMGQRMFQLPVKHLGRVRLERVLDAKGQDARIERNDILVVECPSTTFIQTPSEDAGSQLVKAVSRKQPPALGTLPPLNHCPLDEATLHVRVRGLAPLELSFSRNWKPHSDKASKRKAKARPSKFKDAADPNFGAAAALKDGVAQTQVISHIAGPHFVTPLDGAEVSDTPDKLAAALRRAVRGEEKSYAWAEAQDVDIPITLDLREAGAYRYKLERVRDACGNALDVTALVEDGKKAVARAAITPAQDVVVHPRVQVSFDECSLDDPKRVLAGQENVTLALLTHGNVAAEDEWKVSVYYDPDVSSGAWASWTRNITLSTDPKTATVIRADGPGKYSLEGVHGKWCGGEVGAPWTCPVQTIPRPMANITFQEIQDKCAGPVGVKALAVLVGSPPFKLAYQEERKGEEPVNLTRIIHDLREEIEFRPSEDGEVTYRFTGLHDAHYKNITLTGPEVTQSLHPLASAKFNFSASALSSRARKGANGQVIRASKTIHTCDDDTPERRHAAAAVELSGMGPFSLTYTVRADADTGGAIPATQHRLEGIDETSLTIGARIPDQLAEGGMLTFTLDSIRDGKGCERPITHAYYHVEVRRTRPVAAFVFPPARERGETSILHNAKAKLPVRLVGDAPWNITLALYDLAKPDRAPGRAEVQVDKPDGEIVVDQPGRYVITGIKDKRCNGKVVPKRNEYDVILRARPSVAFDAKDVTPSANGTVREPVCVGTPDTVDLVMDGHFPLQITYEHTTPAWGAEQVPAVGDDAVLDDLPSSYAAQGGEGGKTQHTFHAAQKVTSFQLSTLTTGLHKYRLKSLGDTVYAPFSLDDVPVLHQHVHALPSATFGQLLKGRRPSFCVGDNLAPQRDDVVAWARLPTLTLTGQGPWTASLSLRDAAGRMKPTRWNIIWNRTNPIFANPNFRFMHVGKHILSLDTLVDATGCERTQANAPKGSLELELDVAETASIASAGTRGDFCVGESVDFVLQGTAPWNVRYTFNGKTSHVRTESAAFSRVADRAGELRIVSVAHESNRCGQSVEGQEGMVKKVHELPTVKISGGRHYVEDLREGTQSEINFALKGVPPFSFTFQRTEPADRHANPKVLETRTVTGVQANKWSTFASEEGTWSVTWLQDRYCAVSLLTGASGRSDAGPQKLLEL